MNLCGIIVAAVIIGTDNSAHFSNVIDDNDNWMLLIITIIKYCWW